MSDRDGPSWKDEDPPGEKKPRFGAEARTVIPVDEIRRVLLVELRAAERPSRERLIYRLAHELQIKLW